MTSVIAFAIGLLATLVLASFLTPARWWRRPNARALAVLAAGTWGIGSLILPLAQTPAIAATDPPRTAQTPLSPVTAGREYLVFEALNLRSGSGVSAPRIAVVPVGATVTATGRHEGDWWQVHTKVKGRETDGWASSLWLRRADERHP